MPNPIPTNGIHHLTLTVTDLNRSEAFYTTYLGFQKIVDLSDARRLYSLGGQVFALTLPYNTEKPVPEGTFNENQVGLDHVSFNVAARSVLDDAVRMFDDGHVSHGDIRDLGEGMGICVLAFRDPDNIQIELTSPR